MGSIGGGKGVMICGNDEAPSSESTVEIKIKTLDSQTYTLRVDKCVPVPTLKEQIAIVTGVLSDQQRLICRGKVLKDDQLLSAYHVEDGHTLHLVVRQPIPPPSESFADHPATDPSSTTEHSQANQSGPSVVVGTFNISEQGDGVFPDFGRIVSAVLGSLVIPSAGSGSEAADMHESISERLSRTPGLGGLRNLSGRQADDTATRSQSNLHNVAFPLPTDVPLDTLQPPVIPDSLATLSQYLSHMRQEFSGNVRGQVAGTHGSNGQDANAASHSGLPTPASLAEVMASARQLLMEQAAECLMQLTRQLEDQANVTDSLARTRIQSNALRSGALLQNLGAFLLELGRTTMTLRMGQAPADAVVNAGPAVFISTSGPNPIMVQPLPFQPGTSFGAASVGNVQPGHGASVGSGLRPSNVDIRIIRTGSLRSSAAANQREPTGGETLGQNDPAASGGGNASNQAAARSSSSTRESEVRVVPVRTVVTSFPLGRAPSDSSRGSMGILHQVLARAQHVDSGTSNSTGGQASEGGRPHSVENGRQPIADYTVQQQNTGVRGVDGATHGQRFSTDAHTEFDQFLRTIFPSEQSHGADINFQGMGTNSASSNVETTQDAANSQEAAPRIGDEGTFLANLLRQIIPVVSQNITETDESSQQGTDFVDRNTRVSSTEVHENPDRGTSSRGSGDNPPSSPSSKRQKGLEGGRSTAIALSLKIFD